MLFAPSLTYSFFLQLQEHEANCCHNFDLVGFVSLVQQDLNIISRSQNAINTSCYFLMAMQNYGGFSEDSYNPGYRVTSHSLLKFSPTVMAVHTTKLRTVWSFTFSSLAEFPKHTHPSKKKKTTTTTDFCFFCHFSSTLGPSFIISALST